MEPPVICNRDTIISTLPPPPPGGGNSLYMYTSDLLCLEFSRPNTDYQTPQLAEVRTPLQSEAWESALSCHPDRAFARYIVRGLREGFHIGFNRQAPLKSASSNLPSAREHPDIITDYLEEELRQGRMLGPFKDTSNLPPLQINRFGVIPKGHDTGKWRLITDLSFPPNRSVNDGIDDDFCHLSYISIDQVAEVAARLGRGALLAKVDIEAAYRLIPVHPHDRPLQAMRFNDLVYIDPMLPFGLCSAPKIFNATADALTWILESSGIRQVFHYLDDFIIVAPPNSPQCQEDLHKLECICARLGVPLATHKRAGPTSRLVFLGIEIDTIAGSLRLPADKLERLKTSLQVWRGRTDCSRKELESLIGTLHNASRVVRSGRSFLRGMINLLQEMESPAHRGHPIRLNKGFRSDLAWWDMFAERWNGSSFLPRPVQLPSVDMASDASGSWGCGAWFRQDWFQVQWDRHSQGLPIAVKELLPIILATATWGHRWRGLRVVCHCDNQVVVSGLRSRSSRQEHIMHLLRCLVFIEARHDCYIMPEYINTTHNHLADDLSRNYLSSFLSKVPQANRRPSQVPLQLLPLLLDPTADWTSLPWRRQFADIFRMD